VIQGNFAELEIEDHNKKVEREEKEREEIERKERERENERERESELYSKKETDEVNVHHDSSSTTPTKNLSTLLGGVIIDAQEKVSAVVQNVQSATKNALREENVSAVKTRMLDLFRDMTMNSIYDSPSDDENEEDEGSISRELNGEEEDGDGQGQGWGEGGEEEKNDFEDEVEKEVKKKGKGTDAPMPRYKGSLLDNPPGSSLSTDQFRSHRAPLNSSPLQPQRLGEKKKHTPRSFWQNKGTHMCISIYKQADTNADIYIHTHKLPSLSPSRYTFRFRCYR